MAKLRGTQHTIRGVEKQMTTIYDEMFPNDAPHHLVIMGDEEYKKYNKEIRKGNYIDTQSGEEN